MVNIRRVTSFGGNAEVTRKLISPTTYNLASALPRVKCHTTSSHMDWRDG